MGKPTIGIIAVSSGYIDELWDVESPRFSVLFSRQNNKKKIRGLLAGIDRAICFSGGDSPVLANLRHSGIREIYDQEPFPPSRTRKYDYHLGLFNGRIEARDRAMPLLFPPPEDTAIPLTGTRCLAVIHPGSGSPVKNWPLARFVSLSHKLSRKECDVLWLLGPAESAMNLARDTRIIRDAPLLEILSVLSRCDLYIGNDSGVSHCAAALGRPCIVLYGPSDAFVWRPFGDCVHTISAGHDCAPCHRLPVENRKNECAGSCMEAITVDRVWSRIRQLHAPQHRSSPNRGE